VKFAFIAERKVAFPVAVLCRVLEVSRSGFYDYLTEPETPKERRDASLAARTRAVFVEHKGRYGSPRVCRELRERGDIVNEKKVAEVMRQLRLVARPKKRFRVTTDSKHEDPIAPNLLQRDFTAKAPNEAWVTDVTAIWTRGGWVFLAAIVDLFARRVVGWATSTRNDTALALDAFHAALATRRPLPGLVHHSDRGSPYASDDYRRALTRAGAIASMSRKGDCWDNAVAESFFATLKTEAFGGDVPADPDDATRIVGEYIDGYYNTNRRHSFIDYESPIQFELKSMLAAMAA
jgi:transposase InsO family protein